MVPRVQSRGLKKLIEEKLDSGGRAEIETLVGEDGKNVAPSNLN